MSKKGLLPDLLFVKPIGGGQRKAQHTHVVFIVEEWDELGRPLRCRLCADADESINVEDLAAAGGEFITGYVQSQMLEERPEKANKKMEN